MGGEGDDRTRGEAMSKIRRADAYLCDIEVERQRTDAIQAFLKQETIFVEIETDDGISGTGYSYTIGTGGRAVLSLLKHDLFGLLLGGDARQGEGLWEKLFCGAPATAIGPLPNLALGGGG